MIALTELVQEGRVRYIGFSEWSAEQIKAAAEMVGVTKFVSSQPQYSMLWREPEAEVFPVCAANGIGQIVWSPLGQGVLTGKYKAGQAVPKDSRAASDKMNVFIDRLLDDKILSAVETIKTDCGRRKSFDGATRARVGFARRAGFVGDYRRDETRTDRRQREGFGREIIGGNSNEN